LREDEPDHRSKLEKLREDMPTKCDDKSSDENNATELEAYYETLASQEEIYLEEIEETARARFLAYDELESLNAC
jgi:hypothetical protein